MRRSIFFFSICVIAVLLYLVSSVWTLLTLLVCNGHEDAITAEDLAQHKSQLIPKIIHQTYKNTSIPEVWQAAQDSCLALHQDWQYIFWTDESSEDFIAQKYPWFLDTFVGYEHSIQRADAIRYFALEHYGGIYIDLDDGCNRSLEPLLSFPSWVRKTKPTGISNDVMGAAPKHPFFKRVTESLQEYDHSWGLPYITVMSSTGPLFLSMIWRRWTAEGLNVGDEATDGRVRILFPDQYMSGQESFFTDHVGNSWHSYDVDLMFWMLHHWIIITIVCFIVGFTMIFLAWLVYDRLSVRPADRTSWRKYAHSRRLPLWMKTRVDKDQQDLINRHAV